MAKEWSFLKRIDATKSSWKLVPAELRPLAAKFKRGEEITREELTKLQNTWVKDAPFFDADKLPFVLYIEDRAAVWGSKYKYHFMTCRTIREMKGMGRDMRYKAKFDIDNPKFPSVKRTEDELDVCKNCLKEYDFSKHASNYRPTVEDFNMEEFFHSCSGVYPELSNPTKRQYGYQYTKNWPQLSRNYKEKQGWQCEECWRDCSHCKEKLHTHHINGTKDDNRSKNLMALCQECHAKQPMHGFMEKTRPPYLKRLKNISPFS